MGNAVGIQTALGCYLTTLRSVLKEIATYERPRHSTGTLVAANDACRP
jgi:hypothetical protein